MPRSRPRRPPACALLAGLLVLLASLASATAEASPPAATCRLGLTLPGPLYMMGYSVGTAGDVNADGFADVIVGAWIWDGPGSVEGRAYVYFGGPVADSLADMTLTGRSRASQIGPTAGTAGDVNGDGYDDVIVSATLLSDPWGDLDAGRAHVYFGGASPDTTPDLVLSGEAPGDHFGIVSSAGDMNGDGYADVIVGAPDNDAGGESAGRAYVYFGGAGMDSIADLTLTGEAAGDRFGYSARTAGDLNGDGYADLVIGAYGNDVGGTNTGRAYVFFGGPSPDATADLVLAGPVPGSAFGGTVSTAGDMNGDGYDDVIVAAPYDTTGSPSNGAVYVFLGGASPDAIADLVLTDVPDQQPGRSLDTAGDVNGDGFADVVVGGAGFGFQVFYGGAEPDGVPDLVLKGELSQPTFGEAVGTAGDVNGDGFADLVIGATIPGAAYVYDCNRYFVLSPNGGETWVAGSTQTVSWLGAELADVWLSTDGGGTYGLLASAVGGDESNSASVVVPGTPSAKARVKVTPHDPLVGGRDSSDAVFTVQGVASVGPPGPATLRLRAPWPNPGREVVTLALDLPGECVVTLGVHDLAGREVARPIAGERCAPGTVTRHWRPGRLAPGVYTVRAEVGGATLTRRLVWLGGR